MAIMMSMGNRGKNSSFVRFSLVSVPHELDSAIRKRGAASAMLFVKWQERTFAPGY